MKIKAIANFAHGPSKKSFRDGQTYEVQEKSAAEFVRGGLAVIVEEPKVEEAKVDKSEKKPAKD